MIKFGADGVISDVNEATLSNYDVTLYPNPANSELRISSMHGWDMFSIVDAVGSEVMRHSQDDFLNGSININHLTTGVYSIRFYNGVSRVAAARFVKQ